MCLAIPLRLQAVNGEEGVVASDGFSRSISLCLTPEARVGDYVLVHSGYAINVIDPDEAAETLAILSEIISCHDRDEELP